MKEKKLNFAKKNNTINNTTSEENYKGKTISIPMKYIIIASYSYITLPILIFFVTWLKWYIGILCFSLIIIGLIFVFKDANKNEEKIIIPFKILSFSIFLIMLWIIYSGLGGYFYQTGDNHWRNALFRDMVNNSWPIIYSETNNALVYYFMFWIVPSLLGKIGGWELANFTLFLWGAIGIILTYILILKIITPQKNWHVLFIAIMIIFWSGENLIGIVISNLFKICNNPVAWGSFEGWLDFSRNGYDCSYLYRSNIDALCQVYNQTIVPWLATTLILYKPKTKYFAFLGLCVLPYAPLPFIGLLPFMLILAIKELIPFLKEKKYSLCASNIFSFPNLIASIVLFPVFWILFSSNVSFSTGGGSGQIIDLFVPLNAFDLPRIFTLLLFYFLEFGIFVLFIYKSNKRNPIFWVSLCSLIIIPFFKIGAIRDFCMNVSLPALLILMIFVTKYLMEEYKTTYTFKQALNYIGLIIVICISFTTLIGDAVSKTQIMHDLNVFPYVADDIKTFSDKQIGDIDWLENFLVPNPDDTVFFKYFAK